MIKRNKWILVNKLYFPLIYELTFHINSSGSLDYLTSLQTSIQTRYMNGPSIQFFKYFFGPRLVGLRISLSFLCHILSYRLMKIKIKKYGQYRHMCFENYLLNWTWWCHCPTIVQILSNKPKFLFSTLVYS